MWGAFLFIELPTPQHLHFKIWFCFLGMHLCGN